MSTHDDAVAPEIWRTSATTLVILGVVVIGMSFTWGRYADWVWPFGAIVSSVGLLNFKLRRALRGVQAVVALGLIALALLRFFFIGQVREVEHEATLTISPAHGDAQAELALELVQFPEFTMRLESDALAKQLKPAEDKPAAATVRLGFEVIYDFDQPRHYKLVRVGKWPISVGAQAPPPGQVKVIRMGGGWKPAGATIDGATGAAVPARDASAPWR